MMDVFEATGVAMVFNDEWSDTAVVTWEPDGFEEDRETQMTGELCHTLVAKRRCTFGEYMRWRHAASVSSLGGLRFRQGPRLRLFAASVRGLHAIEGGPSV
jgi:hypothetical protein